MQNVTVRDILKASGGTLLCGSEDTYVEHITIDSRKIAGNDIFVPFVGERVDGHNYIQSAFKNGAAASFSSKRDIPLCEKPIILVDDVMKAMLNTARWYRKERIKIPVTGVTGSVGKTSTREIISRALSAEKNVFSTKGNYNGQIGVPMTMCDIDNSYEAAVIEMGISLFGEMDNISSVVCADCAVVTNIGKCHIENLLTQENILTEKFKIADNMPDGGTLILNGDDRLLRSCIPDKRLNTVYYGTSPDCRFKAENITVTGTGTAFDFVLDGKRKAMKLQIAGKHNVMNALAAFAVCESLGVDLDAAAERIQTYSGFARRMERVQCRDYLIIDDAYNASTDSVKAAIDVFSDLQTNGKKYIVLADMLELGEHAADEHKTIGAYLAGKDIDTAVFIGTLSRYTAQSARDNADVEVKCFDSNAEAYEFLKENLIKGDAVLFKGSHSMKLEEIIEKFIQSEEK